jgi:SAM-dependent methyltransferase
MKLNMGCGSDIKPGYVNVDRAALPGVDVVCELDSFPWPFADGSFDVVEMINVFEHLSDPVRVVEELYRITRPDAVIHIRVPHWNSYIAWLDPTHKRGFHPRSFDFFDPTTYQGRERPYYSRARFKVRRRDYWIRVGWEHIEKYFLVRNLFLRILLDVLSGPFSNVITLIEFELVRH